ncbi:MAG: hypothetical protein Q9228_001379 [Teloschistes exilis]
MPFSSELLEVVLKTPSLTRQMPPALGVNQQSFIENPVKKEETEQDQDAEDEEEDKCTRKQRLKSSWVMPAKTGPVIWSFGFVISARMRPRAVAPRLFNAVTVSASKTIAGQKSTTGPAGNDDPEKRKVEG